MYIHMPVCVRCSSMSIVDTIALLSFIPAVSQKYLPVISRDLHRCRPRTDAALNLRILFTASISLITPRQSCHCLIDILPLPKAIGIPTVIMIK